MIPRLKPLLGMREIFALFYVPRNSVHHFEEQFAHKFNIQQAIAYPYGRSALWAFFRALSITEAEIIMPAYTCSVVGHAIVESGNVPRFVDISLHDYNMSLVEIKAAISEKTRAIVATHLFGYPMNMKGIKSIIAEAEVHYGHKIWLISDCAHSFGASYEGVSVVTECDVALFGLNISKTMTSIFGGMLTTNNSELAQILRNWRDENFKTPSLLKGLQRRIYLSAVFVAFLYWIYNFVYWLQNETNLLSSLTDAYHLDDKIHLPPDYNEHLLPVEASVGLQQLLRYDSIIEKRRQNAQFYDQNLREIVSNDFILPPLIEGSTYSHYVIRVADREAWVDTVAKYNVELGILIEYSMTELSAYKNYVDKDFPISNYCSKHMINLPIHANLTQDNLDTIVKAIRDGYVKNKEI